MRLNNLKISTRLMMGFGALVGMVVPAARVGAPPLLEPGGAGGRHLVVLVNKMDEVGWSRDRYMAIIEQLKPFLANAGFDVEKQIHWVPIAGHFG